MLSHVLDRATDLGQHGTNPMLSLALSKLQQIQQPSGLVKGLSLWAVQQ